MNKRLIFIFLGAFLALAANAQNISGFNYHEQAKPAGDEWQSPENLALNKEQPRAYFFSFANTGEALKVLPEYSSYCVSLDGMWDFHWAANPESRPVDFFSLDYNTDSWDKIKVPSNWNIEGIGADGSLKYGVPIYVNQQLIFQHRVAVDDWRGGVMRTPNKNWTTYEHRNEVGSYRRTFTVPEGWDEREVFINFDGVDSFFYLWINGEYVGFSKNSRNVASFNISSYLRRGENTVALEVYRNSDGSFLEVQDMFRLAGVFRSVTLRSTPQLAIRNLKTQATLDASYTDGVLSVNTQLHNYTNKNAKNLTISYSLHANKLYSDNSAELNLITPTTAVKELKAGASVEVSDTINIAYVNKWSAEEPYRYTLVAQLKDKKGRVIETVSTYVGFRSVEIKDTEAKDDEFSLAGRYFYVNGKPVKLKGVNRHETHPSTGHTLSHSDMEEEIMLMKRANINHVRNSHYPTDPYWYMLCDKYGIYVEDEANIESHCYYYGDASLSHPKEWEKAHVARCVEMVEANRNHPSIVIWSLGNEAGPGANFVAAYDAVKKADSSRPVQYERNNDIVDMGSNQYPSISWVQGAVRGNFNIKYPFHISEYAHSMGNACGNLDEYWEAIESTNFICGGAIWDWVDQSLYYNDKTTGEKFLAYGGDFGDTPNDGQFVMNGILFADREPKPQYYHVKKVYQQIGVKESGSEGGVPQYEVFNKHYFTDLSDYMLSISLYCNGEELVRAHTDLPATAPRSSSIISLPFDLSTLDKHNEYFVKFEFTYKNETAWADTDYVIANEQLPLKQATQRNTISSTQLNNTKLRVNTQNDNFTSVTGDKFKLVFDMQQGTIHTLSYGDKCVIEEGCGAKLCALRAFVNNDIWIYSSWFERGLHNLQHKVLEHDMFTDKEGRFVLSFTVESQAPNAARIHGGTSSGHNFVEELTSQTFGENDFKFTTFQVWTVYPDGSVELNARVTSNDSSLILPRLGYLINTPKEFSNFSYYGRGPIDNYSDRKSSQFIELFNSSIENEVSNFPKPQQMGNHEDCRWCSLTDNEGDGMLFIATEKLSVTALPYSSMDMVLAPHQYQLPEREYNYLHLDYGATGLGGYSCGQGGPLSHQRVTGAPANTGFIIRPLDASKTNDYANIKGSGYLPISVTRADNGTLNIESNMPNEEILYTINGSKPIKLTKSTINLREGGKVTAWYKNQAKIRATVEFSKIISTPAKVISASSEESGEGRASHLTDKDSGTIWHTAYSVTVAKYPHWVDFDIAEAKLINGFTILARQDGSTNGMIKEYDLEISVDGKKWTKVISKSALKPSSKVQEVKLDTPVKGRYVRFTALSSHNNQDFASAAEFTILAD